MKKKRILSVVLMIVMVLSISITSFAASNETSYDEWFELMKGLSTKIESELTANEVTSNEHRHIKLEWERIKCANGYNIQISTDEKFKELVVDRIKPSNSAIIHQSYSTSISDVSDETLYIRIRPVCDKKINGKYYRMYGRWSDTITADLYE